jgi:hypothetical protein
MINKAIRIILVFALIFSTTACYSTKIILPEEIIAEKGQPIDHVILQNGRLVNLENGFIKDDNVYGDVIKTISLQSIVEAYDKKGNIITSAALAFQSQGSNFNRYLDQIERAKLATGETVNFLKVKDYKDGVITVLVERECQLFTSDEVFSTPVKPKRLSIDAVNLKDGRRIALKGGFIMNGKVYVKRKALRNIPFKSIVEAYDKKGKVISVEDIASHADRKDFIKYTSGIVKVKLDTYEVLNFEKITGCQNGEMAVLWEKDDALFSLNEIATAEVEVFDGLKTTGAVIGVAAIGLCVGLIQFAINGPITL